MSADNKKFYVTTPIYYVNARPHIGHAYTTIVADVLARRHRLLGEDTFFLTGTDEHGQKIERSAAAAGIPPQQFADEVSDAFQNLWKRMGLTFDKFIRTTDPKHARGVQHLFNVLYERGFIYLSTYTGQYCVSDEVFVDVPVGAPCPDCGRLTETVTEENFFFKLSEFQKPLLDLIESNTLLITPETRKNEVLSFLRGNVSEILALASEYAKDLSEDIGRLTPEELLKFAVDGDDLALSDSNNPYVPGALKDLSISRSSFTWGIPVPEPAASEAKQKHVIYVWLDALANYMTAIGYGSDDPNDIAEFAKYWPADLHLVGKEIIRFHCVYWPAFLLAAGLPLPKAITAHGWLLFDNAKMSKSKGNIVRSETILEAFGEHVYAKQFPESTKGERDLFASDVLRYFLLREIPFGQDGSFSFDAMWARYDSELGSKYGNLVSRVATLINSKFGGRIPYFNSIYKDWSSRENAYLLGRVAFNPETLIAIGDKLTNRDFAGFLADVTGLIGWTNDVLARGKPWADESIAGFEREVVLYVGLEAVRLISALLYPVLPHSTSRIWSYLKHGNIELAAKNGELNNLQWGGLKPGTKLGPLAPIFPRAPKELVDIMSELEEKNALAAQSSQLKADKPTQPQAQPQFEPNPPAGAPALVPPTEETVKPAPITIDDFAKVELRVAQVLVAERIPKADKLLRLEVDLGYEKRQILSGIAEWYTPEELVGRRIVVITNLAPRKMRGLESHGMLLAASESEGGKPVLATFSEEIALGSRLK